MLQWVPSPSGSNRWSDSYSGYRDIYISRQSSITLSHLDLPYLSEAVWQYLPLCPFVEVIQGPSSVAIYQNFEAKEASQLHGMPPSLIMTRRKCNDDRRSAIINSWRSITVLEKFMVRISSLPPKEYSQRKVEPELYG